METGGSAGWVRDKREHTHTHTHTQLEYIHLHEPTKTCTNTEVWQSVSCWGSRWHTCRAEEGWLGARRQHRHVQSVNKDPADGGAGATHRPHLSGTRLKNSGWKIGGEKRINGWLYVKPREEESRRKEERNENEAVTL